MVTINNIEYLSVAEAGDKLNLHRKTLLRKIKEKEIDCFRPSKKKIFFTHQHLEDYVREKPSN